jgi:hypothetical protein
MEFIKAMQRYIGLPASSFCCPNRAKRNGAGAIAKEAIMTAGSRGQIFRLPFGRGKPDR